MRNARDVARDTNVHFRGAPRLKPRLFTLCRCVRNLTSDVLMTAYSPLVPNLLIYSASHASRTPTVSPDYPTEHRSHRYPLSRTRYLTALYALRYPTVSCRTYPAVSRRIPPITPRIPALALALASSKVQRTVFFRGTDRHTVSRLRPRGQLRDVVIRVPRRDH